MLLYPATSNKAKTVSTVPIPANQIPLSKVFSELSYRFQKYQYYTYQEDDQNYRHFYKVDKVLIRLHINLQCIRIDSKTVRNQCTDYKPKKEYKEEK